MKTWPLQNLKKKIVARCLLNPAPGRTVARKVGSDEFFKSVLESPADRHRSLRDFGRPKGKSAGSDFVVGPFRNKSEQDAISPERAAVFLSAGSAT
jgi:hypothetical protein